MTTTTTIQTETVDSAQAEIALPQTVSVAPANTNGSMSLEEFQDELEILRLMARENADADKKGRETFEEKQQERQRNFLERSWKQAELLLRDENLDVLTALLEGIDKVPAPTFKARCEQVAALQIGFKNKEGKWITTARREVRIGQLYQIFFRKGWVADGLAKLIKKEGGTSKLLAADNEPTAEETKKIIRRRDAVLKDRDVLSLKVDNLTADETKWHLALVSTHKGELKVHTLTDHKGKALDRYIDGHCKKRYAEMALEAEQREEAA